MKRYSHLQEKARRWRTSGHSLSYICYRLSVNKSTAYYWVKGIPYKRSKQSYNQVVGTKSMQEKYRKLRDSAYIDAVKEASHKMETIPFRDFINLYITEGYRRNRNSVAIANSNPEIVALSEVWLRRLTEKPIEHILRVHEDHNVVQTQEFWASLLGIKVGTIKTTLKSNSCRLKTRNWRNLHGIMTLRVNDTYLRSKLQGYMDVLEGEWKKFRGVVQPG
jgi:hypothetical protein